MDVVEEKQIELLPVGLRIGEIMEEKGGGYTIRTLAVRVGISREILRKIVAGTRPVSSTELQKIADGLHVPAERINQDDARKERAELQNLLTTMSNPHRALQLAKFLSSVAIGISERSKALNDLGRAYFDLNQKESAHQAWLDAYEHARKVRLKYGQADCFLHIVRNLIISFTARKEYIRMSELFREIEPLLADQPEPLGAMCYAQAKMAEHLGDDEEAKKIAVQSLRYYQRTQDRNAIGRASINVAHYEFKTRHYEKAKVHLEKAIAHLDDDLHTQLIARKEYTKVLIKLGDLQKANEVIEQSLFRLETLDRADLEGKFYVLLSITTDSSKYAERVLSLPKYGERIRHLACLYLIDYYKRIGDVESLFRYYKYAAELEGSGSELLHRGDL